MKISEFIETYQSNLTEFCACVIEQDGNVVICEKGHLQTLQELYVKRTGTEELPEEARGMFWLIVKLKAVVVDYENQVYSETLSESQKGALKELKQAGLITLHLSNIHKNTD